MVQQCFAGLVEQLLQKADRQADNKQARLTSATVDDDEGEDEELEQERKMPPLIRVSRLLQEPVQHGNTRGKNNKQAIAVYRVESSEMADV